MNSKKWLVLPLLVVLITCSIILIHNYRSYSINKWQVINNQTAFKPQGYLLPFKDKADKLDDSKIYNISRYTAALMKSANTQNISKDNLFKAINAAMAEQPHVQKIPVVVETVKYENKDAFAITFKYSQQENRLGSLLRPFWPIKMYQPHYQVTVVEKENNAVLFTAM